MNRHEKESSIASLKEQFSKSQATFVVSYKGLTVMQLQKLRRAVRAEGGALQVAKTTLMTPLSLMRSHLFNTASSS